MSRPIHSGLVILKQLHGKQGCGNCLHKHKHACYQHVSEYTVCTSTEDRQVATQQDPDVQSLKSYVIQGWPHNVDEMEQGMQKY